MKKLFVLIFTLFISTSIFSQSELTLEKAISIALHRNSNLIKGQNNLETNKSQLKSAYGDLLPNLNVRGSWSWNRIDDDGGTTIIDFFGQQTTKPATKSDSRNYNVSAGGNITLFDGLSNYANISQKRNDLNAARLSLEKLKQDIIYQTTNLYYTVLNAQELVKVRKDNLKFHKKLLEQIQARNKLGSVPIADVYTQQVQLGNAQLLLIQAQNNYETTKSNILNYLALDVLEEYTFERPSEELKTNSSELPFSEFKNIKQMVKAALDNRKDYQSQKLSLASAENGLTIAKGGLFPSLSGNYSFSTQSGAPKDLLKRRVWNVGLSLNFPIFSNWNTENQIQFAKVKIDNAAEDLTVLERQIKIEIKQGYLDLVAAKKQLDVSTANVRSAKENRRINKERYSLGSGTILDVLQADKDYTQALNDRINAEYSYYKLRDKLINSLGKLEVKKYE